MESSEEQRAYLDRNLHAVLATTRRDGSPQASTVHFSVLDGAICVGAGRDSAKWRNAGRQPQVVLVVTEGPRQLVIYGTCEQVEADPQRVELYRRHRASTALKGSDLGPPPTGEAFRTQLDDGNRVMLRITPQRVLPNE